MSRPPGPAAASVRSADVQLRTFPSDDRSFRAFSRAALLRTVRANPAQVQDAIRERYPAAVIRVQNELARRGDAIVWYAFRFGSIADAPIAMPFDCDDPDVAVAIIDDERRFLEVDDRLVAIVELPREQIVGRALEEFTNPEDPTIREDMATLWREFTQARVAESTIRFNRADGSPRQLAYRIVADEPAPGQHRLRVRALESPPAATAATDTSPSGT